METHVFLAVLGAAACHAGWNALIKLRLEPLEALVLMSAACGLVAAPFVPVVGLPQQAAWPYIVGSLLTHLVYYTALAEAYRAGDLGQVYPIARGAAPLMTATGATLILGESLGLSGWLGISLIALGILLLSWRGGRDQTRFEVHAVGFALLTAASIAIYTLIDGVGGRLSGNVGAYIVWLFLLDGLMMAIFGLIKIGRMPLVDSLKRNGGAVLLGGVLSTVSYAVAVWAMTVAPVALVAALRETSVLFAAAIGVLWLGEPLRGMRIVAGIAVMAGLVLLRLK